MTSAAPDFELPAGSCDCHTHVFLDEREFPWWAARRYTPPPATIDNLTTLHDELGLDRVVVVQPSVYGLNNAATLHALCVLGPARARGVAVIDAQTPDTALDQMAAAGVVGVRVNLEVDGERDSRRATAQLRETAERVARRGWHVQVYASTALLAACHETLAALPVPLVLDHFAGARTGSSADQDGIDAILGLVESGRAYVKLSAPYRCAAAGRYGELSPLARRLIHANPDRMLWGSDWPHPQPGTRPQPQDIHPPFDVDLGHVLDLLREWVADDSLLHRILVDNPARLYHFHD